MKIEINLTELDYKVAETVMQNVPEWIQNAIDSRIIAKKQEMLRPIVEYCLSKWIQIPATQEAIIEVGLNEWLFIAIKDIKVEEVEII